VHIQECGEGRPILYLLVLAPIDVFGESTLVSGLEKELRALI
jgi:hypothetical protein